MSHGLCSLLLFAGGMGVLAAIVALWLYLDDRAVKRREKDLAEATISEEELTVQRLSSEWRSSLPTPPMYLYSQTDQTGRSSCVPPGLEAMAWQSYYHEMDACINNPQRQGGWFEHRFTTEEYPAVVIGFNSSSAIQEGQKLKVKLWKHCRNDRVLAVQVV